MTTAAKTTVIPQAAQAVYANFRKVAGDQLGRMETLFAELGRYEKQGIAQVSSAIDEMSKLSKDGVECVQQVSEEWRKHATEASQRFGEIWNSVLA